MIGTGEIMLSDLLEKNKITELETAFADYNNESLGELKEKFGEDVMKIRTSVRGEFSSKIKSAPFK